MVITLISLALGTFVSEDLACVSAGWLIQRGQVDAPAAILACTLGIFSGDVGLWGIGRVFGRAALAWPLITRVPQRTRLAAIGRWLEHHAALANVSSRFLPA